jgi:hypothetical protein
MAWHSVIGPREAGPSEREQMVAAAMKLLSDDGVDDATRIDVPAKGTSGAEEVGAMRDAVAGIVPALQSGSLFGGATGVIVVDAQSLLKNEVDTIAELLAASDPAQASAVFVAIGSLPAAIKRVLTGDSLTIKAITERDAAAWLADEAKHRGLRIDQDARTELMHRFGSDTSAMGRALDQLAIGGSTVTAADVESRFTNRPDEPMWLLGDAIMTGGTSHRRSGVSATSSNTSIPSCCWHTWRGRFGDGRLPPSHRTMTRSHHGRVRTRTAMGRRRCGNHGPGRTARRSATVCGRSRRPI